MPAITTKPKRKRAIKPKPTKEVTRPAAEPAAKPQLAKFAGKYFYAVGRRKASVAEVRLYPGGGEILINRKPLATYFPLFDLQKAVLDPLKIAALEGKASITVLVRGGGIRGQAEATRLGIARALVLLDAGLRSQLKARGFLKRDARVKERRKYGLKKARRAPQWQKR